MTEKVPVATFPCSSEAVHVTVVVPIGKNEPEPGLQTTTTSPSTRSVAVGCGYTTVAPVGPGVETTRSARPVIVGGVVSWTVTVKVSGFGFPPTVQVTVLVPMGKTDPDGGSHMTLGWTAYSTTAPAGPCASTTMFGGVGIARAALSGKTRSARVPQMRICRFRTLMPR